jgi:hypothetical protein
MTKRDEITPRPRKRHTVFRCGDRVIHKRRGFARVSAVRVDNSYHELVLIIPTDGSEPTDVPATELKFYHTTKGYLWPPFK